VNTTRWSGLAVGLLFCLAATGCGDDTATSDPGESTEVAPTAPETTVTSTSAGVVKQSTSATSTTIPSTQSVEVIESYPHEKTSFTQGLELIDKNSLIESTGQYGESAMLIVDLETGVAERSVSLGNDLFGEGATSIDEQTAVQLTWRSGRALVYDTSSLRTIDEHTYEGEGWGLCLDDTRLVMSDGTDTLRLRDPDDFSVLGSLTVTRNGQSVDNINELECVDGDAYANIYTTDEIVRIDLDTGEVVTTVDASGLLSDEESAGAEVLNGIAYDRSDGTFLITGKYWPRIFRVRFI
jgi:glutamine cyclotransferase